MRRTWLPSSPHKDRTACRYFCRSDWEAFSRYLCCKLVRGRGDANQFWCVLAQRKPDSSQQEDIVGYFSEGYIIWIVNGITVLASAILLVGAIAGLYFEKRDGRRLAMIGCLTLIFALAVGTLTNARRAEIFASTAAYVISDVTMGNR